MKNVLNRTYKGFTIIEVMIVLAIAGLIMVVVFLAIPQLQRSQRNNAREAVMNRISAEVNNFASNNSGAIPTADAAVTTGFNGVGGGFYVRYINSNASSFTDPSTGVTMILTSMSIPAGGALTGVVTSSGTAYYSRRAVCNGESAILNSNDRNFVVATLLEGGAIYCLDNR